MKENSLRVSIVNEAVTETKLSFLISHLLYMVVTTMEQQHKREGCHFNYLKTGAQNRRVLKIIYTRTVSVDINHPLERSLKLPERYFICPESNSMINQVSAPQNCF